jgi:hypothetical protein
MVDSMSDFELVRLMLRPCMVYAEARTLRDVLAMVNGAAVALHPPHGSGFLPGFYKVVNRRFNEGRPQNTIYHTLLQQYGHLPMAEACEAVLRLLEEWKASTDQG